MSTIDAVPRSSGNLSKVELPAVIFQVLIEEKQLDLFMQFWEKFRF